MAAGDLWRQAGFRDGYSRLRERFADILNEQPARYGRAGRSVAEEIVRCIWFGGHYPPDGLSTDDGRRLEVLSPGWWNVEGGPDFVRAEFVLERQGRVVGDVEVHTLASAWQAHGHHRQPEYNDVALHVALWNDRDDEGPVAEDGSRLPQLTLNRFIQQDLEELVELMGPEDEQPAEQWTQVVGRYCGQMVRSGELQPQWLGRLLDAAGDHRILGRATAFAELYENHPREQLLYERIAEALGYKNNRMPFLQLAGLLPVEFLRSIMPADAPPEQRSLVLEAALLVTGGLVAAEAPEAGEDEETAGYRRELLAAWENLGEDVPEARLSADHWSFEGTRPVNYPSRRLAALARLCARHLPDGLFAHLRRALAGAESAPRQREDVAMRRALLDPFLELEHPYWSRRYTLGGRRLDKPRALIGRERALTIVVNVLLPMLLAHADAENDPSLAGRLRAVWQGLPRRPDNTVTRRMEQVIFGDADQARAVVGSARRQQGLHQLYRDCCRTDRGCERCVVYLAHRAGETLVGV